MCVCVCVRMPIKCLLMSYDFTKSKMPRLRCALSKNHGIAKEKKKHDLYIPVLLFVIVS